MIQRKTLLKGIRDEQEAINYYLTLISLSKTEEEKDLYTHIMNQEREHKRILEYKLKTFTEKKRQNTLSKLLSV